MKRTSSPSGTSWGAVALVVLAGVIACVHLGKVAIATPALRDEYGLGLDAIGWLAATFALVSAVGGIPAGAAVAAAGDRGMLVAGLIALTVGSALGTAQPWLALPLSRLVEGLGFVLVTVAGPAMLQRLVAPADRNLALALWSCFVPAGIALAMLVGPWFEHWRSLWWAAGIVAAGIAGVVLARIPRAPAAAVATPRRLGADTIEVLRAGGPLALAIAFALYSLMFYALFSFLPVLLIDRLHMSPSSAGPLGALASAANIVGNLAAGGLIARIGRVQLVLLSAIAMGLCAAGIFFVTGQPWLVYLLCVVFSMVGGLVPSTLLSWVPVLTPSPSRAPIAVGLAMQGSGLGQALGPLLVGALIEGFSWAAAGVLVIASAVALPLVIRRLRTQPAPEAHAGNCHA
jgi:predicted MFS family arabinose efflux permease